MMPAWITRLTIIPAIAPSPHSLVPQQIGDSANCRAVPNSTTYSLQPVQWKAATLVTQKFNHDDDEDEDEDFPMSDIDNSSIDSTSAEDSAEDLQITNKEVSIGAQLLACY